ncbi:MAG: superoxide dismutase [candidate division Zixibacteria bacterium HGW-Zixibacteria-1]|nr:MAG: superoxide dismutase [candidate division Zixibacteria bacterium HGW-Zixibacteria-1]
MKGKLLLFIATLMILSAAAVSSWAHCEIPCGIYNDEMRYDMLAEDIQTIEKSMDMIIQLSAEDDKNYNQIVRWVNNKEEHTTKFMDIVSQYFLNQRLKPVDDTAGVQYDEYIAQLTLMHKMLVTAMKCKQTTDKLNTAKLSDLLAKSKELYFKEHNH